MNLPKMPPMPLSSRQTLVVTGVALVVAAFVVIVYHYATRSPEEHGA